MYVHGCVCVGKCVWVCVGMCAWMCGCVNSYKHDILIFMSVGKFIETYEIIL